jgi:DNA-binding NarL/FixJ family response regulator
MPLKILIVAEPGLLCQGLKSWLREDPGLAVCGLACSELEALYLTYQLEPDLVLVDLKLAGYPRLIEALSQAWPPLPIVVFSADLEKARLAKALESGASGYLGQKLSAPQLCQAVKAVAKSALMVRAVAEEKL